MNDVLPVNCSIKYKQRARGVQGRRAVFVGVEPGSERVRSEIVGKNLTDEQLFKAFGLLASFGFEVEISAAWGRLPSDLANPRPAGHRGGPYPRASQERLFGIFSPSGYVGLRLKRNAKNPGLFLSDIKDCWSMLSKGHSTISLAD